MGSVESPTRVTGCSVPADRKWGEYDGASVAVQLPFSLSDCLQVSWAVGGFILQLPMLFGIDRTAGGNAGIGEDSNNQREILDSHNEIKYEFSSESENDV
jgi:hypothetical protein